VCETPDAADECATCLNDNCQDQYCACANDEKCMCVLDCLADIDLDGNGGLDLDVLNDFLDDLFGNGGLDGIDLGGLGDILDNLVGGNDLLECLTTAPCGAAIFSDKCDADDLLDPESLLDCLDGIGGDAVLANLTNGLGPLTQCGDVLNPGGSCGLVCPLQGGVLGGQ